MNKYTVSVVAGMALFAAGGSAFAQTVNKSDRSQPTPGEIAMATECRDTYTRMRALEKLLDANRDEFSAVDVKIKQSSQKLDELQNIFEKLSALSQTNEEAYQAALKAKTEYEAAAAAHNVLVDEQDAIAAKRVSLSDEFYVVNPNYVGKCSGTIFKYFSVILTCKDEKSEWCDLLK